MLQRYYSFCSLRQQQPGSSSGALVYTKSNPNMRMFGSVRTTPTASPSATERNYYDSADHEGRGVSSSSTACGMGAGTVTTIAPPNSAGERRGLPPLTPSSSLAPRSNSHHHRHNSPQPSRHDDGAVDVEGVLRGFQSQHGQRIAKTTLLLPEDHVNSNEYDFEQQLSENDEDSDDDTLSSTTSSSSSSSFGKSSDDDFGGHGLVQPDSSPSSDSDSDNERVATNTIMSTAKKPTRAPLAPLTSNTPTRKKPTISHEERLRVTAALSRHRKMLEAQDVDIYNLQRDLEMTTTALVKLGGLQQQHRIKGGESLYSPPPPLQHGEQLLHEHPPHINNRSHSQGHIVNSTTTRFRESINDDDDYDEYDGGGYGCEYDDDSAAATSRSMVGGVRAGDRSISCSSAGGAASSHRIPQQHQKHSNRRSASVRSGEDDMAVTQTQPHIPAATNDVNDDDDDNYPLASTIITATTSTRYYSPPHTHQYNNESLLAEVEYYGGGSRSSSGSLPPVAASRLTVQHHSSPHRQQHQIQQQQQPLTARTPNPTVAHPPSPPQSHHQDTEMKWDRETGVGRMMTTQAVSTCDAATSTPHFGFLTTTVASSSVASSSTNDQPPPFSLLPHHRNSQPHALPPSPTNSSTQTQEYLKLHVHQPLHHDSRIPSGNLHHNNVGSRSGSCLSAEGGGSVGIPIPEWEAASSSVLNKRLGGRGSDMRRVSNASGGVVRMNSGGCYTTTSHRSRRRRQSNGSVVSGSSSAAVVSPSSHHHLLLSDTVPPPPSLHQHSHHISSSSRKQNTIQELMSELDELDDDTLLLLH